MITLFQTSDPKRFDVAFSDPTYAYALKAEGYLGQGGLVVQGYISKIEGLWVPHGLSDEALGAGEEKPLDAAKKVFPDYSDRARAHLIAIIESLEQKIDDSPIGNARRKMVDGLKAKLAAEDF